MPATLPTRESEAQGVLEIVGQDLEALLDFYLSMGFELERRSGEFAVVHWRGTRLFLAQHVDAAPRACWSNLRIVVDDVDTLWARAQALGLRVGTPIGDRYYGLRDFLLVDPAGFGLRFAQALAA